MGLNFMFSSCSRLPETWKEESVPKKEKTNVAIAIGNPNPKNFQMTKFEKIGRFLVVRINYPDCKNYEGDKILVYENVTFETISKLESIDPHFCDHKSHHSPIARFFPTNAGWDFAVKFCRLA